ncbi:MAG: phosphatidylserine decarboxylase [Deltaproteobacteria bacterium CG2_30_66_27]|nr:MAG: phosphatidylserine decarboxylase [Deltaproteobacteria bacterium CG2_30_66_27]PJB32974.1 MAG: phosphatidylserine decarboxylase family protein [Deltaproteobacteria bacterium CG_4_9_14_3_um_filter_65_9]
MSGRQSPVLAPEGWPFVLGGAAFAVVVYLLWPRGVPLAAVGILLALFSLWFFRNPGRTPPMETGVVVSPADGRIVYAGESPPGRYALVAGKRVSVFMSPFDVHVNRAPVTGRVASVRYHKGAFNVASVDKASLMNEQNAVAISTPEGRTVTYVQIAGMLARRIVCDLKEGDAVLRGQRVGMIRFGSRLDLYLPAETRLSAALGDRVRAGESVVGVFR